MAATAAMEHLLPITARIHGVWTHDRQRRAGGGAAGGGLYASEHQPDDLRRQYGSKQPGTRAASGGRGGQAVYHFSGVPFGPAGVGADGGMPLVGGVYAENSTIMLSTRSSRITPCQVAAEAKVELATLPGLAAAAVSLREAVCSQPWTA